MFSLARSNFFHALVAILLGAVTAQAGISPELKAQLQKKERADVLIQFGERADLSGAEQIIDRTSRVRFVYDRLKAVADRSQGRVQSYLRERGARFTAFYIENAVAVDSARAEWIQELATWPEIHNLTVNVRTHLREIPVRTDNPESKAYPNGVAEIGADRVWTEFKTRGRGIVIGGQDTGFAWLHPAIRAQYRGNYGMSLSHDYNWHDAVHRNTSLGQLASDCVADAAEPCDDKGHGTHTMGTMVGEAPGEKIGVAPDAKWVGCRNMKGGTGTVATYLECFEYFLAPYPQGGNPRTDGRPEMAPHIVNNSWACTRDEGCTGQEFVEAVRAYNAAGILLVVAAGNDGPDCGSMTNPPGTYVGQVASVGAFDTEEKGIAFFSSRGPSKFNGAVGPDLVAPGADIRSAIPGGGYERKSGTSMASPHVAGAVALLWSAQPALIGQIPATLELLRKTSNPLTSRQNCGSFPGSQIPNSTFGFGHLNAFELVKSQAGGSVSP